eukprot:563663-Rhodomonas_salina.4
MDCELVAVRVQRHISCLPVHGHAEPSVRQRQCWAWRTRHGVTLKDVFEGSLERAHSVKQSVSLPTLQFVAISASACQKLCDLLIFSPKHRFTRGISQQRLGLRINVP